MSTTPTGKDRQINPNPSVGRISLHEFYVRDLLRWPDSPNWHHTLYVECEHCHCELTVRLYAPFNVAQFVEDEARRVAVIEHLRTEHPSKLEKSQ